MMFDICLKRAEILRIYSMNCVFYACTRESWLVSSVWLWIVGLESQDDRPATWRAVVNQVAGSSKRRLGVAQVSTGRRTDFEQVLLSQFGECCISEVRGWRATRLASQAKKWVNQSGVLFLGLPKLGESMAMKDESIEQKAEEKHGTALTP